MNREAVAFGLLGLLALLAWRTRGQAPAPVDNRADTSSLGPVEHVTDTPTPAPLPDLPDFGEIPDYGITLPDGAVVAVPDPFALGTCETHPLDSFHPECVGVTWTAFSEGNAALMPHLGGLVSSAEARRLTPVQVRHALLDPAQVWFGYDLRRGA